MIPFLSTADVVFATGVVAGVIAFATGVWALAWWQRPAPSAGELAAQPETVTASSPADARVTAGA